MNTFDFLELAVKEAEKMGASEAEAFREEVDSLEVKFEKLTIKETKRSFVAGLGLRVTVDKHIGFAYTSQLSKKKILETVDKALKIAKLKPKDPNWISLPQPKKYRKVKDVFDAEINNMELEQLIDPTLTLIQSMKINKKIVSGSGGISVSKWEKLILNSYGLQGNDKGTSIFASAFSISSDNEETGTGMDFATSTRFKNINFEEIGKNSSETALKQLGKKKIETFVGDIVFHPFAFADLLQQILAPELYGDNVFKKKTPFYSKLNQKISTKNFTLIDNGLYPAGLGSSSFDDEGTPTQETVLLEKGVLKGFLYDNYWAGREKVESTGNASRSYSGEPSISFSNLIVKPGNKNLTGILSEIEEGIYVISLIGTHTANIPSGNFSVASYMPFKIEEGEIMYPIKQAMISSDTSTLLSKIDEVGKDLKVVGGVVTPPIKVKNVAVSA